MATEILAGAVLEVHQRESEPQSPLEQLDALIKRVRGAYDDSAVDVLERLNEAREALVELEAKPYEPDEMDLSRADRQRREEDAEVQP